MARSAASTRQGVAPTRPGVASIALAAASNPPAGRFDGAPGGFDGTGSRFEAARGGLAQTAVAPGAFGTAGEPAAPGVGAGACFLEPRVGSRSARSATAACASGEPRFAADLSES